MTQSSQSITSLPRTRSQALSAGSTKYYTGKPCPYGHITYRYTKSAACMDCARPKLKTYLLNAKEKQPERFYAWRKKANDNWNHSEKGLSAKQRWKKRDPKWAWVVSALGGCRQRCEKSKVPYDLTNEYVYSILVDTCPALGIPLIYPDGSLKKGMTINSPTLDRLVPALGYVKGNVAILSLKANAIKSNANSEEVKQVADWMREQNL